MKSRILNIILFLFFVCNVCQTQTVLFYKVYEPNPENYYQADVGYSIIFHSGYFYLADLYLKADGDDGNAVIRTDNSGNQIAQATFDSSWISPDFTLIPRAPIVNSKGCIIWLGQSFTGPNWESRISLMKMNSDMDTVFLKYYGTIPKQNYASSILEGPSGDYYIFNSVGPLGGGGLQKEMITVDSLGNLVSQTILQDTFAQTYGGNMAYSTDGNFVFCADARILPPPDDGKIQTVTVTKIDPEGNEIWRTKLNNYYDDVTQSPILTALHNGGSAVVWVKDTVYCGPGTDIMCRFSTLTGIDANGNKLWETEWHEPLRRVIRNIRTAANGDIIGCGFAAFPYVTQPDPYRTWVFRLNENGEKLWEQFYTDEQRFWSELVANDIIETPDGRLALTGFLRDQTPEGPHNVNPFLLVLDSLGCLEPGCNPGLQVITAVGEPKAEIPGLHVAPNPAHTEVHISAPEEIFEQSNILIVYDMKGKVVHTQSVTSMPLRVYTHKFPPGKYQSWLFGRNGKPLGRGNFIVVH